MKYKAYIFFADNFNMFDEFNWKFYFLKFDRKFEHNSNVNLQYVFHRLNGPAIEYFGGFKEYWENGKYKA